MKQILFLSLIPICWLLSGCSSIVQNQLNHPQQFEMNLTGGTMDELLEFHHLEQKKLTIDGTEIAYLWGEAAELPKSYKPPKLEFKVNIRNPPPGVEPIRHYKYEEQYWDGAPSPAKGLVVLLHSYSTSSMSMLFDSTAFQVKGYNTLLVDLLGHGENKDSPVSFGPQDIKRLHTLIQHVQTDSELPLILYGKSYGTSIAAQYIEAYGQVDALVAVAPMTHFTRAAMRMSQVTNPKTMWLLSDDWVEKEVENTLLMAGVSSDSVATPSVLNRMPEEHFPSTLLLVGEKDTISDYDEVEPLVEHEKVTLFELPQRGHMEMMIFDNTINEHLYNWLNNLSPEMTVQTN